MLNKCEKVQLDSLKPRLIKICMCVQCVTLTPLNEGQRSDIVSLCSNNAQTPVGCSSFCNWKNMVVCVHFDSACYDKTTASSHAGESAWLMVSSANHGLPKEPSICPQRCRFGFKMKIMLFSKYYFGLGENDTVSLVHFIPTPLSSSSSSLY